MLTLKNKIVGRQRSSRKSATLGTAPSEEHMYQTLYNAIVEHHLPPGTKLPEDALADAFSVSRTRIRTVLQLLSRDGIVELQRYRGAFVAQPSVKEARQVFEARRILESGVIPVAVRRATATDVQRLRKMVKMGEEAVRVHDRRATIKHSGDFHIQICDLLDNAILTAHLRDLVSRSSLVLAVYPPSGAMVCDAEYHERIVNQIEAGDAAGAVAAMLEDLEAAERGLALEDQGKASIDLKRVVTQLSLQRRSA
jgi:DNA-binding GntR family transcriptional regulator